MVITVDRNIYSDACISKAIYWLSDSYTITRSLNVDKETISFTSHDNCDFDENELCNRFFQLLNDFKLKQIVEKETHAIRTNLQHVRYLYLLIKCL